MNSLDILFVGQLVPGSRSRQRVAALRDLGHRVRCISTALPDETYETPPSIADRLRYRLRIPADKARANQQVTAIGRKQNFDVLWLERAVTMRAETLRNVKSATPSTQIVWYAEDDMMSLSHRTRWLDAAIPEIDLWVTTKSFNAEAAEMPSLGVRQVLFVNNAYDPKLHRPVAVSSQDQGAYGADVAFVGTYEKPRAGSLFHLAECGIDVRVWGNGWAALKGSHPQLHIENRPVYDEEYAKVVGASAINLCFLRKANRDLQTCRSMEVPAFGGFMLHERNEEISALFADNREAAYFSTDEELVHQCRRWLADENGRREIATAGRRRAIEGKHSHPERLRQILAAARGEAGE